MAISLAPRCLCSGPLREKRVKSPSEVHCFFVWSWCCIARSHGSGSLEKGVRHQRTPAHCGALRRGRDVRPKPVPIESYSCARAPGPICRLNERDEETGVPAPEPNKRSPRYFRNVTRECSADDNAMPGPAGERVHTRSVRFSFAGALCTHCAVPSS